MWRLSFKKHTQNIGIQSGRIGFLGVFLVLLYFSQYSWSIIHEAKFFLYFFKGFYSVLHILSFNFTSTGNSLPKFLYAWILPLVKNVCGHSILKICWHFFMSDDYLFLEACRLTVAYFNIATMNTTMAVGERKTQPSNYWPLGVWVLSVFKSYTIECV